MSTTTNNLRLTANAFSKCAPNISTNIKQCGTVTLCSAKAMTQSDLANFTKSGDYLVMGALLKHDMEIRMCEAKQHGLFDFFMSNKMNFSKKLQTDAMNSGLIRLRPFVFARQYSQINNEYWAVSGGTASGDNWRVDVASTTNIPADVRSFAVDQRVYISGTNGSTGTKTAWKVVSATLIDNAVRLVLSPAMAGSFLAASRLTSPVTGLLVRGTANKNDYEKWCNEPPAYLNWKDVPFWVETQRTTMCKSENYDLWRKLLMAENPLYARYGDLDDIAKNKQLAQDWQKRQLNTMIWGTASDENQTISDYDQLPTVESYAGGIFDAGGAKCIGVKADMIGFYEQMVQCGRVMDLQGGQLNLPALFTSLYSIMRVREASSQEYRNIDIFTDSITAEAINQAMIAYYNAKSQNTMRLTLDVNQDVKKGEFGFNWRSYNLMYPAVRINIVTHFFFDDYLTANTAVGQADKGRLLWVLDMAGIYPGVLATNRRVLKTGDLQALAAIDKSYACVMEVQREEQTLVSITGTMVVECPMANLLLENFSDDIPEESTVVDGLVYPATTTTTTTTSTAA